MGARDGSADEGGNGLWPGVVAVAATYFHFLLFAQFGFLALAAEMAGPHALRPILGAMGVGGVLGSVAAVRGLTLQNFRRRLVLSYIACGAVAAVAPLTVGGAGTLAVVAAALGLAVAWNTVTLASGLRRLLPEGRLGLGAGLGTGLAYAGGNVPTVFAAAPRAQAWIAAAVALAAGVLMLRVRATTRANQPLEGTAVARWVMVFLALVWLDSAAFYTIQHSPELRGVTWTGDGILWTNAAMHLLAAIGAGWWLDRGRVIGVVTLAWGLLAAACLGLGRFDFPGFGLIYAAGVSLYSAALVFQVACDGRPWVAASVFAVAGWIGSGVGIGLAQPLDHVPVILVVISGAVLSAAGWLRLGK